MSLRIRRGTNAQRLTTVLDLGEISYTTDSKKLFIGDGITAGGVNALVNSAGVGLEFNASTQTLDFTGSGLSTSNITEGTNLYFTAERAQDAVYAALLAGQSLGNVTFTYNDVDNKLYANVTPDGVGLTAISQDASPALGGNLVLSTHNITGTGNINITGSVTATTISANLGSTLGLNGHDITGSGNINITGGITATSIAGIVNASTVSATTYIGPTVNNPISLQSNWTDAVRILVTAENMNVPGVVLDTSNGTVGTPTDTAPGDLLGGYKVQGYHTGTYKFASGILTEWQDDAVMTDSFPRSSLLLITNAGPDTGTTNNQWLARFDGHGVFTVPTLMAGDGTAANPSIGFTSDGSKDTGFYHPGDGIVCISTNANERVRVDSGGLRVNGFMKVLDVAGNLPSPPEAGMIVLDGSTFKGYNGSAWVNLN